MLYKQYYNGNHYMYEFHIIMGSKDRLGCQRGKTKICALSWLKKKKGSIKGEVQRLHIKVCLTVLLWKRVAQILMRVIVLFFVWLLVVFFCVWGLII